jgi:hypothetical protein
MVTNGERVGLSGCGARPGPECRRPVETVPVQIAQILVRRRLLVLLGVAFRARQRSIRLRPNSTIRPVDRTRLEDFQKSFDPIFRAGLRNGLPLHVVRIVRAAAFERSE